MSDIDAGEIAMVDGGDVDAGEAMDVRLAQRSKGKDANAAGLPPEMNASGVEFDLMDGDRMLPVRPSMLYPPESEVDPIYLDHWTRLGVQNMHARDACGDLDGMLEMMGSIHGMLIPNMGPTTPMEACQRAGEVFGIDVHCVCSTKYVEDQYEHLRYRILKLFSGIQEQITTEAAILAASEGGMVDGARMREGQRQTARLQFIAILQALSASRDLLVTMNTAAASLTYQGGPTNLQLPSEPFTPDMSTMKPSQVVTLALYRQLSRSGFRRMGNMIMEPRFVTVNGREVFTHAFQFKDTIESWVEKETAVSKDNGLWAKRGAVKFVVEEITNCETFMFPRLKVKQGLYASRDALLMLAGHNPRVMFYDQTDPRVVDLRARHAVAVESIESAIVTMQEQFDELTEARRQAIERGEPVEAETEEDYAVMDDDVILGLAQLDDLKNCIKVMRVNLLLLRDFIVDSITDDFVAEKFVDQPFPWEDMAAFFDVQTTPMPALDVNMPFRTCRWQNSFQCPSWRHLFEYQGLPEDAVDVAGFVMTGRAMNPPKVREDWQVLYEEVGFGNTGKTVKADFIEALHKEKGAPVSHTGIIMSSMERQFGMSQVLGETEDRRAFVLVCREITPDLRKSLPLSDMLTIGACEEGTFAVKNKAPLIAEAPHSFWWGNRSIPHANYGGALNRRRFTVRNDVVVRKVDPQLKRRIMGPEMLPIMLASAIAYHEFTGMHKSRGIWNKGVLPEYFHDTRELNDMTNKPLKAFIKTRDGDDIQLDTSTNAGKPLAEHVQTFMSMQRLRTLVGAFVDSNKTISRVDWSNTHEVKETLEQFQCQVLTPSQMDEADLPSCLKKSMRGQFVVGVSEFVAAAVEPAVAPAVAPSTGGADASAEANAGAGAGAGAGFGNGGFGDFPSLHP